MSRAGSRARSVNCLRLARRTSAYCCTEHDRKCATRSKPVSADEPLQNQRVERPGAQRGQTCPRMFSRRIGTTMRLRASLSAAAVHDVPERARSAAPRTQAAANDATQHRKEVEVRTTNRAARQTRRRAHILWTSLIGFTTAENPWL